MYVSEICAEGIFVTFPWWLKNVKSRSRIAFFQMSTILKFDFQKRKQFRFSEVNYLNYTKKTQFCMRQLHFSLKQRETRTSHGSIPHPLNNYCTVVSSYLGKSFKFLSSSFISCWMGCFAPIQTSSLLISFTTLHYQCYMFQYQILSSCHPASGIL